RERPIIGAGSIRNAPRQAGTSRSSSGSSQCQHLVENVLNVGSGKRTAGVLITKGIEGFDIPDSVDIDLAWDTTFRDPSLRRGARGHQFEHAIDACRGIIPRRSLLEFGGPDDELLR